MRAIISEQKGFTLVELLISTTVFSVILLAGTATLIQVSRMYYKGVITSKTQSTTRAIIDEVTRSLQFSGGDVVSILPSPSADPKVSAICFSDKRLNFSINGQVSDSVAGGYDASSHKIRHGLWQDTVGSPANCSNGFPLDLMQDNPGGTSGKELLEQNMRISKLSVVPAPGTDDVYNVTVGVVYGDDDLLNFDGSGLPTSCKSTLVGGQWCSVSVLNTQIYRRVERD